MAYQVIEEINIFRQGGLYFTTFIIEDDGNVMPPQRSNVFYPDNDTLPIMLEEGKIAECRYWTNYYINNLPTPEPTPIPDPNNP